MNFKVIVFALCALQLASAATIKDSWDEAVEAVKKEIEGLKKNLDQMVEADNKMLVDNVNEIGNKVKESTKQVEDRISELEKSSNDLIEKAKKADKNIDTCLNEENKAVSELDVAKSLDVCKAKVVSSMEEQKKYVEELSKYSGSFDLIVPACLNQISDNPGLLRACVNKKIGIVETGLHGLDHSIMEAVSISNRLGNTCLRRVTIQKKINVNDIEDNLYECVQKILK